MDRIYLSPPDMAGRERELLLDAFDSNWIAPLGPHVDAFEKEFEALIGRPSAALSSGTAALHLALILAGVEAGDEVVVPTFTFVATANAVTYVGATPIFVDSEPATWNLDPDLLAELLADRAAAGRLPAAVIAVDLYGQCADYDRIVPLCEEYEVPLIEDAAEALGATWRGRRRARSGSWPCSASTATRSSRPAGAACWPRTTATSSSEPGTSRPRPANRPPTTSTPRSATTTGSPTFWQRSGAASSRRSQRRSSRAERSTTGIGRRSQTWMASSLMPHDPRGAPSCWLTVARIDPAAFGASNYDVWTALAARNIEARPAWKPMHLQPVFAEAPRIGGTFAASVFGDGVCLPSGPSMTEAEQDRRDRGDRRGRRWLR